MLGQRVMNGELSRDDLTLLMKISGGLAVGLLTAIELEVSGISTWIHEVLGHIYLGGKLLYNYPPGMKPTYVVHALDKFRGLFHSSGITDFFTRLYDWQLGPLFNGGGVAGFARGVSRGAPNRLGRLLGPDSRQAWVSLSGSLPAVGINTGMVVGGLHLHKKEKATSTALITTGLAQHLMAAEYTWHPLIYSVETLISMAKKGHDFASFAVRMTQATYIHPYFFTMATALTYTASVPALAAPSAYYLWKRERAAS